MIAESRHQIKYDRLPQCRWVPSGGTVDCCPRILLVQTQAELGPLLSRAHKNVAIVDWVRNSMESSSAIRTADYSIIILDADIPNDEVLELIAEWRCRQYKGYIIVLSRDNSAHERSMIFNGGADVFLSKPVSFQELQARLRVVFRRMTLPSRVLMRYAGISLNLLSRQVFQNRIQIYLTRTEFALLEFLLTSRGHLVTRRQIAQSVWGRTDRALSGRLVDAYMHRIRTKLATDMVGFRIHTIRGVGFQIEQGSSDCWLQRDSAAFGSSQSPQHETHAHGPVKRRGRETA